MLRIDASALLVSPGYGEALLSLLDEHLGRGHERRGMRGIRDSAIGFSLAAGEPGRERPAARAEQKRS